MTPRNAVSSDEQQAEAVEAEMEPDAERVDPRTSRSASHGPVARRPLRSGVRAQHRDQRARDRPLIPASAIQRGQALAPAVGRSRRARRPMNGSDDEPEQDHRKMTIVDDDERADRETGGVPADASGFGVAQRTPGRPAAPGQPVVDAIDAVVSCRQSRTR